MAATQDMERSRSLILPSSLLRCGQKTTSVFNRVSELWRVAAIFCQVVSGKIIFGLFCPVSSVSRLLSSYQTNVNIVGWLPSTGSAGSLFASSVRAGVSRGDHFFNLLWS